MVRPLRLEHPGALWHVTARGNQRDDIFRSDEDRETFVRVLGRTSVLFRWRLMAWVLMGNHYHLLLETPERTLSRGMRDLNSVYAQAFNRRHRRVGHVLQGRFKAILVERESHLMELCRYVVLNPVRARMVKSAKQWRWSSFRATAGIEQAPEWLDARGVRELFGGGPRQGVERYWRFVLEGAPRDYDPWHQVEGQIYLGSEEFRGRMQELVAKGPVKRGIARTQLRPLRRDRSTLVAEVEREVGASLEELRERPRLFIMERRRAAALLRERGLLSMAQIGDLMGVREWQASTLVRAGRARREL